MRALSRWSELNKERKHHTAAVTHSGPWNTILQLSLELGSEQRQASHS